MKKAIILCIFCLFRFGLMAQNDENLCLLVARPSMGKGVSAQFGSRLENQLLILFAENNETTGGKYSAFAVLPALEIVERGKIEGMKSRPTVKLSLTLKLQNTITDAVLDVREVMLTGSGSTDDEAVGKAISGIRRNQPELAKMLKDFHAEVADYYEKNCSKLAGEAMDFATRKQYREAFSLLQSVPRGTTCFVEVQAAKNDYYLQAQAKDCASALSAANAANAANNFSLSLSLLSQVGSDSPCFNEAKQLVSETEIKVDDELKNQYGWMFKFYSTGAEAETARWNAMNSLFLGWLRDSRHLDLINNQ